MSRYSRFKTNIVKNHYFAAQAFFTLFPATVVAAAVLYFA